VLSILQHRSTRRAATVGVIVLALSASCSTTDDEQHGERPAGVDASSALVGEELVSGPLFGNVGRLATDGETLWVSDLAGDPFLHVVRVAGGVIAAAVGRIGDGPGDFRSVYGLIPIRGASSVWVYDVTARRLTLVDSLGRLAEGPHAIIELPASPRFGSVARLGDRFVLRATHGSDSAERLVFVDGGGSVTHRSGEDLLGDASVPERQRQNASANAAMCARPDGTRFAVAFRYAGRIDLRDSVGQLVARAEVPTPTAGDFADDAGGQLAWSSNRAFYEDCVASDKFVYALFSGWNAQDPVRGQNLRESNVSKSVHVFDWAGRLVGILTLDQWVTSLALDLERGALLGAATATASVYRFALPTAFASGGAE